MNDPNALMWYQVQRKDTAAAFLFWVFLGHFGAHRFYMGKTGSAVTMLLIWILSIPLCFILIGFVTYFAVFVWWIVDAFLICEWVNQHNARVAMMLSPHSSCGQPGLPPPPR
jgi:TM2 domain-containing membrane protein YozV